jgi:hypothetical protein
MKAASLAVCPKCGWYEHGPHRGDECDPGAGRAADALVAEVEKHVPVLSTKLGYGMGVITFKISDRCAVSLDAHRRGTFKLTGVHGLFWLRQLDTETAVQFVCTMVALDDKLSRRKKARKTA